MPMYDRICRSCSYAKVDVWEARMADNDPWLCPECGNMTVFRGQVPGQKASSVNPDDIPGGLYMRHGVCHDDGSARRFDTRSDLRKALRARGMTWGVDAPFHGNRGSDKRSDGQKRWV